jgi:hypothetical protein
LLRELEERSKKVYVPKSCIAGIYWALGDIDKAFELFDKAVEERDPWLIYIGLPDFKILRSDPRFIELLEKIGLE